jgi:hypothetical protein
MKIIIDNVEFPFNIGCRVLRMKYENSPMDELDSFWNEIKPLSFGEIGELVNLEQRRICILYMGMDVIITNINPKLISKKTIKKTTTWIDEKGELVTHKFSDTYELFEVDGKKLSDGLDMPNAHYIRCKDTSTDREYLIWVDVDAIVRQKNNKKITAIDAIAWTFQTNIAKDNIEKIIRQGDCILIKPIDATIKPLNVERHLTSSEYLKLIVAES